MKTKYTKAKLEEALKKARVHHMTIPKSIERKHAGTWFGNTVVKEIAQNWDKLPLEKRIGEAAIMTQGNCTPEGRLITKAYMDLCIKGRLQI